MWGANVTGIDITTKLLALAKEEEKIAGISGINWKEGDAESLPFEDESFDVVLSTFGHIFAPNQELAGKEMVRVLKKGGRLGFSSCPPELEWENYPKLFPNIIRFHLLKHCLPTIEGRPKK
jgi:ubiquinone/menaquinone biosynthesis C-methylase UbiE